MDKRTRLLTQDECRTAQLPAGRLRRLRRQSLVTRVDRLLHQLEQHFCLRHRKEKK